MVKKNSTTLAIALDVDEAKKIVNQIENNSVLIDEIVNKLVANYCEQLDNYINMIDKALKDENKPLTDYELDDICISLPTLLYFTAQGQETLGIREDVAKAIKMEVFNITYDKSDGTIADKTAIAEMQSQNEAIIYIAYNRAYKQIKSRLEIGNELLQSIKKVINRRTEEMKLSGIDRGVVNGTVR